MYERGKVLNWRVAAASTNGDPSRGVGSAIRRGTVRAPSKEKSGCSGLSDISWSPLTGVNCG